MQQTHMAVEKPESRLVRFVLAAAAAAAAAATVAGPFVFWV